VLVAGTGVCEGAIGAEGFALHDVLKIANTVTIIRIFPDTIIDLFINNLI